jgi:hypothetical protein
MIPLGLKETKDIDFRDAFTVTTKMPLIYLGVESE